MSVRQQLLTAALLLAATLLYCTGLDATDLWAPDEPRYGQIAEEVRSMQHGPAGLVLLRLNGEPYTQKPPLYYWLAAFGGWISGAGRVTEELARLPSALAGIAAAFVTVRFGRLLFGSTSAGLWAGALLVTVYRFAHLARRAQLDVLLTLFESLALLAFWQLETKSRGETPTRRGPSLVLLHTALGLAALTKGPVGWLPLVIIAVYLAWERRLPDLWRLCPAWALLLSFGPLIGWISAATWLGPSGFFTDAVVTNVFGRFFAATSHIRPGYYFLQQLPIDFLPWTLLWPLALWIGTRAYREGIQRSSWRLLLLWVAVPFIVFSLASGKRGLYLLPCFPALALLCAGALDRWLARRSTLPGWVAATLASAAAATALAAGAIARGTGVELPVPEGFEPAPATVLMVGVTAAAGLGVAALLAAVTRDARAVLASALAGALLLELLLFTVIFPRYDDQKSPRPIALEAARLSAQDEVIGIFDDEGLAGGILYYGDRKTSILPRPRHVQHFLETGGRLIVLERWKLPWLAEVGRFEVLTTSREGRRQLAIVRRSELPPP